MDQFLLFLCAKKKWGQVRVQAPCLTERREATKSNPSLSRSSIPVEVRQTSSSNDPNGILKFVSAMKLYLYRVCWVSEYLWMLSRCAVIHAWLQGTWGRRDSASLPHTASLVTVSQLSAGQGCSGRFWMYLLRLVSVIMWPSNGLFSF